MGCGDRTPRRHPLIPLISRSLFLSPSDDPEARVPKPRGGGARSGHLENCRADEMGLASKEYNLEDGQATKGNRRMPWGKEPMKGVAHDDTPRGAASKR